MTTFFGRPVLLGDSIGDVRQNLDLPTVIWRPCTRMTGVVRGNAGKAHRRGWACNEGVQGRAGAPLDLRGNLRGVGGVAAEDRPCWDAHGSGRGISSQTGPQGVGNTRLTLGR